MRTVTPMTSAGFSSFDDFLKTTAGDDRQFLAEDELNRFPPAACGMANGAGGWIAVGASVPPGEDIDSPQITGVNGADALLARLEAQLCGGTFSSPISFSSRIIDGASPLLVFRIEPSEWPDRPVSAGEYRLGVWRRIEGIDVISGLRSRFRLAFDSLERLRCDGTADAGEADLHEESVSSFREAVIRVRPEWAHLGQAPFLRRTLVMSGSKVTKQGLFLLGKQGVRVRAETGSDIFEVRNLWRARTDILPRISAGLSDRCAAALRECFLNAMLHTDYDDGRGIIIRCSGRFIVVQNPGLARTYVRGVSSCRNYRLMRIFRLTGDAQGTGSGLAAIRRYQPDFALDQDAVELSTAAILRRESAGASSAEAARTAKAPPRAFTLPVPEPEPVQHTEAAAVSAAGGTASPHETGGEWLILAGADVPAEPDTASVQETELPAAEEEALPPDMPDISEPVTEEDASVPAEPEEAAEPETASVIERPVVVLEMPDPELPQTPAETQPEERGTSFGSAADDLERSIAEMRDRLRARK